MEELSKEKSLPPQLLNLIPDERGWKARDGGRKSNGRATFDAEGEEDKLKLELKLGLPGIQPQEEDEAGPGQSCSALSLARFATHSWLTNAGAKRSFFHTVGSAKPQGCDRRQQQQQDRREGCANELTLGGESMSGERKKGCCPPPPSSHGSAAAAPVNSSRDAQGRAAVAPVVGWPPVRSFRRNVTNGSSSKQSPERQTDQAAEERAKLVCKKKPLIKINMDGIPIGRKVDLTSCDSYQKLSTAVEKLFRGFLQAQKDLSCAQGGEEKIFSGLLDGTGEFVLVYEDNEGDRLLAGDIPWSAFVSTAKRLRVMRRSELPHDLIGANSGKVADC